MMTTLDAVQLAPALQALIDARLDTIERMLLGKVTRHDRLAIVREVESQIQEQIQRRDFDELSREDVLAVLASLDPPEAYLPEEEASSSDSLRSLPNLPPTSSRRMSLSRSRARTSGILGIVTLVGASILPVAIWLVAMLLQSEFLLLIGGFITVVLMLAGGILSVILAARAGMRNGWSIVGLVTSVLSIPAVALASVAGMLLAGVSM